MKKSKQRFPDAGHYGPNKVVTYAYVGRWSNGELGWNMPNHANGQKDRPEMMDTKRGQWCDKDDIFELCRVTVEVIPGARRRRHPQRRDLVTRP